MFGNNIIKYKEQSISSILSDFSIKLNKTIISDFTIGDEKVSFFFYASSYNKAFEIFLKKNYLYYQTYNDYLLVSRIQLLFDDYENLQIDAHNVSIAMILEKISLESNTPILFTNKKNKTISIHISNITVEKFLLLLANTYNYTMKKIENYIIITS